MLLLAASPQPPTSSQGTDGCARLDRWLSEGRLGRLSHVDIALPTFVLQLKVLDRDGVGVGIEVGKRLILGDPAAKHLVGDRKLAGFIVEINNDVLAEIFQRDFGAETRAEVPDF